MSIVNKLLPAILFCAQTLSIACGDIAPEEASDPANDEAAIAQSQSALSTPNVLLNSNFKTVGPSGAFTAVTTAAGGAAGNSAAAQWTLFTNTPGYLETSLSPSSRPGSTNNMIHVRTRGERNGLVQVFGAFGSGYTHTVASAWIYIVSGTVGIGTGNGGNTGIDRNVAVTGSWVYVQAPNGVIPANEFIIYSTSSFGADYYVDFASVQNSPNLLQNPTFATVGPAGVSTAVTTSVPGGAGDSAADAFYVFTNTPGYIATQLVPSTYPGTTRMIRVKTPGQNDGIEQVFLPVNTGPAKVNLEAYVYVRSGKVGIGAGNGGNTSVSATSTVNNAWQQIKATNLNSPANEFIVYSVGGGADFDVAFVTAYEVP